MPNSKKLILFMPFIGIGGVEKNLFIIANFFSKKFKNVIVCTASKNSKNKFNKKISFLTPKKNISDRLNVRFKYIICLYLLFKYLLRNKDTTVFSFQANIYCILICSIFNIKVIIRNNSSPSGWYHNIFKRFIYKKIISMADAVIVNSLEFKKQMIYKFNIPVHCIYNPLNISEIISKSKRDKKDNFFKNKKKFLKIINIGRLTEQKDQITLLKAANLLKNKIKFRLLIIGKGPEKKNLQNYIRQNNLMKHIKINNLKETPYGVMKQADIFILSSKYEGLPNVLLEAITLNKFVISTNCPTGPKEILLNGKGGILVDIGNYEKLSSKIIYYLKNKTRAKKMLSLSKKNLRRFDYQSNLNKYLNLIKLKL